MIEFKLPDLGEGTESGTVVNVLVNEGDSVSAEQAVLEIEVDKATIELPCPHAGSVAKVHVKAGDTVSQGDLLLSLDGDGAAPKEEAKQETKAETKADAPKQEAPKQEAPKQEAPKAAPAASSGDGSPIPAGPAVRRLARLMGVELGQVSGSGPRGRITPEDVHQHVKSLGSGGGGGGGGGFTVPALPDFTKFGPVHTEPLSGVRKATAQHMSRSWGLIPHVTQNDYADITGLEAGRKRYRKAHPEAKVTMTVLVLKALARALKVFPKFNSTLDLQNNQLIYKDHIHIGVAVDTPQGLLVPVLRDVDRKTVLEMADELTALAGKARDRKLGRDDMQGSTFTLSNIGGIGGTSFTPIVNWPEVAILGVAAAKQEYVPGPDGPEFRLHMPLSLSYDHRVIDGAEAARFLRTLATLLTNPVDLLIEA